MLFGYDGPVYRFMKKVADVAILHWMWMVACTPLITAGAATAALHSAYFAYRQGSELPVHQLFFQGFARYWKRGTVFTVLLAAATGVLACDLMYWNYVAQGFVAECMVIVSLALCVPLVLLLCYGFGTMILCNLSVWATVKRSLYLAYAHPIQSVKIALAWIVLIGCNCITLYMNAMTLLIGFGVFVYYFPCRMLLQVLEPEQDRVAG